MRLEDHPGFFGITSQGVIAIHADWPMYPEEHGADLALLWLTALPQGTRFKRLVSRVNPLGRFATTKLAGEGPQVVAGDNLGAATRKLSHPATRSLIGTGFS